MTLLNAPVDDERKEKMQRHALLGAGVLILLLILLTLGGFIAGHGWAFSNLPAEHRVGEFFCRAPGQGLRQGFWRVQQRSGMEAASRQI